MDAMLLNNPSLDVNTFSPNTVMNGTMYPGVQTVSWGNPVANTQTAFNDNLSRLSQPVGSNYVWL